MCRDLFSTSFTLKKVFSRVAEPVLRQAPEANGLYDYVWKLSNYTYCSIVFIPGPSPGRSSTHCECTTKLRLWVEIVILLWAYKNVCPWHIQEWLQIFDSYKFNIYQLTVESAYTIMARTNSWMRIFLVTPLSVKTHYLQGKGPFTLSIRANAAMSLVTSLWLNCLYF